MKNLQELKRDFLEDGYKVVLFCILVFLCIFSIYVLKPHIAGDSLLYTSSIEVLQTGIQPPGFIPMMIVSTYLGLRLIMFLNFFTDSIEISWLLLDSVLYIIMGMFFYSLLKRITNNVQVAFLGTLFLVTNYAAVTFGLGYLMDMGGWASYIVSIYFSWRFLEATESEDKWIYISALIAGIGGLYKEYAFVSCLVIAGVIIWKYWKNWKEVLLKGFATASLALLPIILLNIYGFFAYHYTYLDWFLYNQSAYDYQNRVVEFIKSFGSIYNFGWFLFIPGFYILLQQYKDALTNKKLFFIWLMILSCFTVLLWPVVTRVLFITMPAIVLVSSLFIEKIEKRFYIIVPILAVYVISSYLMDAFVLNFVNLPF